MARDTDRFQAKTRVVVFVLFLLGCLVGVFFGHASYDQETARSEGDRARGYHATADVRSVAVATADPQSGATQRVVSIAWRDPGDQVRHQRVVVPERRRVDATMRVWVDPRGRASLHAPPESRAFAAALGGGLFVVLVTAVLLLVVYGAVCFVLERARLSAWEREWTVVEPRWRRHVL